MGIISNNCCKIKQESSESKSTSYSLKLNSTERQAYYTKSDREIKFSTILEERNYDTFSKLTNKFSTQDNIEDYSNYNIFNRNVLIIDELFYFPDYKLPNSDKFKENKCVENIMKLVKSINYKIEAIVTQGDEYVIMTEKSIIAFKAENMNLLLIREIDLRKIEFITVTRDGKEVILHMQKEDNFIIKNSSEISEYMPDLINLVACITSSYYYITVKGNQTDNIITVITLNQDFEIIYYLSYLKDFNLYK
jgi:hypothetical protein